MKEILIVSKGNQAIAYGQGIEIKKTSTTGVSANLEVLNEVLTAHVPTESSETVRIHLMNLIQGVSSGWAIDYVKTGKKVDGTDIATEDRANYTKFYELYKERLLNVRFNMVEFIPKMKDADEIKAMRSKAYAILNTYVAQAPANVVIQTRTETVDPDKELRETFNKLMTDALKAGDMDTYKALKAERDLLKQPEIVTVSGGAPQSNPKFDTVEDAGSIDDIDKALKDLKKSEIDKPIVFDNKEQDPNWDKTENNA